MTASLPRILVTVVATALAAERASAVQFWLAPSASLTAPQQPPTTAADIPQIGHSLTAEGGSLYIWARPDAGKTLENWSLRVVSSNANVVRLTTSSVGAFNPVLGTEGSLDLRRWESVSQPPAQVEPTKDGESVLYTMQGISVIGLNEVGVGIGSQGAGGLYADPFYHAASNAWLLAQVNYALTGQQGEANINLQIGSHGLNYLGEYAAAGYARLGALSDPLLVGPAERQVNSLTPEAVVTVSETAPSADFNDDGTVDGSDFLVWQRHLGTYGGAMGLSLWKDQMETSAVPAATPIPEPASVLLAALALLALSVARLPKMMQTRARSILGPAFTPGRRVICNRRPRKGRRDSPAAGRGRSHPRLVSASVVRRWNSCLHARPRLLQPARRPGVNAGPNNVWRAGVCLILSLSPARQAIRLAALVACLGLSASSARAADVTSLWDGTTGVWSDSTKWSSPLFPHNGNGGSTYNATVNGGTVTLDQDIEIEKLTFGGGTITGDFDLTLNDDSAWSAGTMSGTGQTTIASGGTLNLTGDSSTRTLGRTLVNDGTTTWTGTKGLSISAGGVLQNNGSFTTAGGHSITGASGVFNNAGLFVKQTGLNTLVSSAFHNSGTADVQGGQLQLHGGGTHAGDFTGAAGTTLSFSGNHSFAATSDITGGMDVIFYQGSSTVSGVINVGGMLRADTSSANVTFNAPVTANRVSNNGVMTFNSTLSAPGGWLSGTMAGTADWTVTSSLEWLRGTMSGTGVTTIATGATLILTGDSSTRTLSRTLVNDGTATWSGTTGLSISAGAALQNNGSFTTAGNHTLSGGGAFHNAGSFVKQSGLNTLVSSAFHNSGTVDVQGGQLQLHGGGTHAGDFTGAAGATLSFSGNHSFAATSDITGGMNVTSSGTLTIDGQVNIGGILAINSSSNTTFNGPVTASSLTVGATATFNSTLFAPGGSLSGNLAGSADWAVTSTLAWTTGTMSGTGQTTIASGGTLNLTGNSSSRTLSRTLINDGTTTWTGTKGLSISAGAALQNNGSFTTSGGHSITGGGIFNNSGSFVKQTGLNTLVSTAFHNTGTVDVQEGTLQLHGGGTHSGDFSLAAGTTLRLEGTHSLAASADVSGAGTLQVGGGVTTFLGQQTANGTFAISGGTVNFNGASNMGGLSLSGGTLTGTGTATFAGTSIWTTGTMSGTGTTTIASEATLSLTGDSSTRTLSRTLINEGTTTWTGTRGLAISEGAALQNNGSFTTAGNHTLSGGGAFHNAGSFVKQSGLNTLVSSAFHNAGTVDVQGGQLQLDGGGNHAGTFTGATGTTLSFGGKHTFNTGANITGDMNVTIAGTAEIAGSVTWSTTGTTTLNGAVTGSGDWNIDSLNWTGGAMAGSGATILANGSISGAGAKTLNERTLRSAGNIDWSQGDITTIGWSDNLIVNGGFETPVISQTWKTYYAGSTELAPWEIVSGSVDITKQTFWPSYEGQNSLDLGGVTSGTLQQSFATVPGHEYTLSFQYGNHPSNSIASAQVNVIGTATMLDTVLTHSSSTYPNMWWTPYTTTFIADSTTTTLRFTDLTNSSVGFALDAVSVTSGVATSTSTIHVPDGALFTISGSANRTLKANVQVDPGGTILHTSTGTTTHAAGTFVNNGLVQATAGVLQLDGVVSGTGHFRMAGGVIKVNPATTNFNGSWTLDNGTLQLGTFSLNNGIVDGTGTIEATSFTNSSVVAPGVGGNPGAIAVTGSYQQTSAGSLDLNVQGTDAGDFSTLSITGVAGLGGTLVVHVEEGSFGVGDEITVITSGSLAAGAEFDNVIAPGLTGVRLVPVYVPAGGSIAASAARSDSGIFASSSSGSASVRLEGHPIGDLNLDGIFNTSDPAAVAADAAALAKAFVDPDGYYTTYLTKPTVMGRVNDDDYFDFDDIHAFRQMAGISMGQMMAAIRAAQAAVPEPSGLALAALAAAAGLGRRRLKFVNRTR